MVEEQWVVIQQNATTEFEVESPPFYLERVIESLRFRDRFVFFMALCVAELRVSAMALRMASFPPDAAPAISLPPDSQAFFAGFSCRKDLGFKSCPLDCSKSLFSSRRNFGSSSTGARAVEQVASTSVGGVLEVTQETFWPVLEAAGDKLVVIDPYTQWCGPCKIMYPKIVDLSQQYADVLFLKLDCNQDNKALVKKLGVKVVPTFKLFRNRKEIAEVKGAKFDELVQSIQEAVAS